MVTDRCIVNTFSWLGLVLLLLLFIILLLLLCWLRTDMITTFISFEQKHYLFVWVFACRTQRRALVHNKTLQNLLSFASMLIGIYEDVWRNSQCVCNGATRMAQSRTIYSVSRNHTHTQYTMEKKKKKQTKWKKKHRIITNYKSFALSCISFTFVVCFALPCISITRCIYIQVLLLFFFWINSTLLTLLLENNWRILMGWDHRYRNSDDDKIKMGSFHGRCCVIVYLFYLPNVFWDRLQPTKW